MHIRCDFKKNLEKWRKKEHRTWSHFIHTYTLATNLCNSRYNHSPTRFSVHFWPFSRPFLLSNQKPLLVDSFHFWAFVSPRFWNFFVTQVPKCVRKSVCEWFATITLCFLFIFIICYLFFSCINSTRSRAIRL